MPAERYTIVGLGELLWDLLPSGRQLGGAPANFAYHAARLGDAGIIASRVGRDEPGTAALARLAALGLPTDTVQRDQRRPTGMVQVAVDAAGQPTFTIAEEVAWDELAWTPAWRALAARADAVGFGSLAQRSARSRATIRRFLRATRPAAIRLFDVNLRRSFYSAEVLAESLSLATVVKLNHDELPVVAGRFGLGGGSLVEQARALRAHYDLALVCVTRGAHGSLLVTATAVDEHPGVPTTVVDTVGAGDAFAAALVHHCLRRTPLPALNEAANRLGAWVASRAGATPDT